MKTLLRNVTALLVSAVMLFAILWVYGFDFDANGVTWSDLNDHCTNWYDSALHPDAQDFDRVPVIDW
jgi:hypothetical protein